MIFIGLTYYLSDFAFCITSGKTSDMSSQRMSYYLDFGKIQISFALQKIY